MAMAQLMERIARSLVTAPDAVSAAEVELNGAKMIELRVAPEDIGRLIGRQGRTARSLRSILAAASTAAQGERYSLEIME